MKALITGIEGQDGHYLAAFLASKGYEVTGTEDASTEWFADDIERLKPDEIYNLAGITRVTDISAAFRANTLCALNCLEGAKRTGARVFQASSCEIYRRYHTPYSSAKVAAHRLVSHYRDAGAWACAGVLFNHESPRRSEEFVTQKVCTAAAKRRPVVVGDLNAARDWGHAKDFVRAMWLMLQQDKPEDLEICTGERHTVRDVCEVAYARVGLDYRDYVTTSPDFVRANEQKARGDPEKLRALGWTLEIGFVQMIEEMVDAAT